MGLYEMPARRSEPGRIVLTSFGDRRDRHRFAEAYADPESGITTDLRPRNWPVCTEPVTYIGQAAIQSDIANFKAALAAVGGLGGRVHPQIAWTKLESLVRGAELATQQLWR